MSIEERITRIEAYVEADHLGSEATDDDVEVYTRISQFALSGEFDGAKVSVRIGPERLAVYCGCDDTECACKERVENYIEAHWASWLGEAKSNG